MCVCARTCEREKERKSDFWQILHFRAVIYDWQEFGYNIMIVILLITLKPRPAN